MAVGDGKEMGFHIGQMEVDVVVGLADEAGRREGRARVAQPPVEGKYRAAQPPTVGGRDVGST